MKRVHRQELDELLRKLNASVAAMTHEQGKAMKHIAMTDITPPANPNDSQQVVDAIIDLLMNPDDDLIRHVERYGGKCRDCADRNGLCDSGLPCDCKEAHKAIKRVLHAVGYGLKYGWVPLKGKDSAPMAPQPTRY